MDLKTNINKIHSDLILTKGIGESVSIKECTTKELGNHFEIKAEFSGMVAHILVEKKEIESNTFTWRYYANPNNTTVGLVERKSTLERFASDVFDIFDKKRFDSEYLSEITE
jgi:fructose 1,6-bisphosphatase